MILTRGVLRALAAALCAMVAVVWGVSWFAQTINGEYLVAARALAEGQGYVVANLPTPVAQTGFPPLFPALLALWSLVSMSPLWLKALPIACSAAWLALTWKLLRRMGAGGAGALLIVFLTAAAPGVITRGTNLFADALFALLITASLIFLLDGQPAMAGAAAGLATLASAAGVALIVACMLTLVIRRRLRDAIVFTIPAILLVAPWFGWALAHGALDPGSGINLWSASNIFTALERGDKLLVVARNFQMLFASPFALLSGIRNPIATGVTAALILLCLIRRRQLLPDLFLLLYAVMLLCRIGPPERFVAPVLPLVLWIIWRVAASLRRQEAVAAGALLLAAVPVAQNFQRLRQGLAGDRGEMERLFAAIRTHTEPDAVLAAENAPLVYLETGRKCIRAVEPAPFDLYYSPRDFMTYDLPPDQFSLALMRENVSYVAVTPADIAEREAIAALERGGILEPLPIEGLPGGYELLRVIR
jgi:hypothetical protein